MFHLLLFLDFFLNPLLVFYFYLMLIGIRPALLMGSIFSMVVSGYGVFDLYSRGELQSTFSQIMNK